MIIFEFFQWYHHHHYVMLSVQISLTLSRIPPYRPLLSAGLQDYIPYRHWAAVCRSELVILPCSSMWRGLQEYITYELVPTSLAVFCRSGSSKFDSFRDGWLVAVQLLLCGVLLPGLVQYCSQHSCVVSVKLFLHTIIYISFRTGASLFDGLVSYPGHLFGLTTQQRCSRRILHTPTGKGKTLLVYSTASAYWAVLAKIA